MDGASQLILIELREFRAAVQSWQQDTGERVAQLETQVKDGVTGNGQPSRLRRAEIDIEDLNRFRYWWMGVSAAIGSIAGVLGGIIFGGKH